MSRYRVLDPVARTPVTTKRPKTTEVVKGDFGRFGRTFTALQARCPDYVDADRWQRCVEDGRKFLLVWGSQAEAAGWTAADLFGLHKVPDKPHPSYRRLSRYDCIGLVWLLQKREVVAITAESATIRNPVTDTIIVFRKNNRPAYGPVGDSLDDLE